ncbi:putative zinc finger protein [Apostichopus japonicus]|uniref:Putative zinc finger protein n=1 Tax=Stichopus japonicus TaxID=307972 RepID=A0A2G8K685_STIJA|nr:putative zinc finger protein [Apostichopus japonicus]
MEMIRGQASPLKDQSQASIHCPVCKREFDEVKVRNVHLCTHFRSIPCEGNKDVLVEVPSRGAKALTCTKCNQEYSSTNYLVRHYQQHHRIRVQLCCFCFDPMESNARLKQHMMDHISHDKTTPLDPNVSGMLANFHTCELCFAIFPNKSTLQRHTTSHIKAKDFICEKCGKAFGRKDTLEDHVERHVQDKTFQCQICGKYLKTARSLVLHLATHTNERNFQCKFCLRGFKQMGNLNKHLLTCG